MRHSHGLNSQATDLKGPVAINHIEIGYHPHTLFVMGTRREEYWGFVLSGKCCDPMNMIAVLMGHEDGTNIDSGAPYPGSADAASSARYDHDAPFTQVAHSASLRW